MLVMSRAGARWGIGRARSAGFLTGTSDDTRPARGWFLLDSPNRDLVEAFVRMVPQKLLQVLQHVVRKLPAREIEFEMHERKMTGRKK